MLQENPPLLDKTMNTTEQTPRNLADVLASGLANIANNVKPDGSDISISVPGMTANNVNDGFSELKGTLAYNSTETTINGILFKFEKWGRVVTFTMANGSATNTVAVDATFGTIPTGYEPNVDYNYRDYYSNMRFGITSLGKIYPMGASITSGTVMRGSFMYIAKQ